MKKITILPKRMENLIDTNVENKKMKIFMKLTLLFLFIGMMIMITPSFAGLGTFFGYSSDNTSEIFADVLTGRSARTTIAMCFGSKVMSDISGLSFISKIMGFTAGVGIIFVLVHSVTGLMEAAQTGLITREYLTKALLTFALPVFMIININMVVDAVQDSGLFFKDQILISTYDVTEEEYENLGAETIEDLTAEKQIDESGVRKHVADVLGYDDDEDFFSSLKNGIKDAFHHAIGAAGMFVLVLFIIFIDIGIRIGIMVACYGALGRLLIYQAFLPMGISDIGKEGIRSNGMKNIKRYFAVYVEIAMFYLLNNIGWKIFDVLILQQDKVVGLIVCFIAAGSGIRALMSSAKGLSERLLNAR